MFEGFPYTNFHELNLDWIIKIAKDFLDQYTNIQQTITTGLEDLDAKAQQLQAALDAWYTEHSEDIAQELARALEEAVTAFNAAASAKAAETIASIPDDYTSLSNDVVNLKNIAEYSVGGLDGFAYLAVGLYSTTGIQYGDANRASSPFIDVKDGSSVDIIISDTSIPFALFEFASDEQTTQTENVRLKYSGGYNNEINRITLTPQTKYIRISFNTAPANAPTVTILSSSGIIQQDLKAVEERTGELENHVIPEFVFNRSSFGNKSWSYGSGWTNNNTQISNLTAFVFPYKVSISAASGNSFKILGADENNNVVDMQYNVWMTDIVLPANYRFFISIRHTGGGNISIDEASTAALVTIDPLDIYSRDAITNLESNQIADSNSYLKDPDIKPLDHFFIERTDTSGRVVRVINPYQKRYNNQYMGQLHDHSWTVSSMDTQHTQENVEYLYRNYKLLGYDFLTITNYTYFDDLTPCPVADDNDLIWFCNSYEQAITPPITADHQYTHLICLNAPHVYSQETIRDGTIANTVINALLDDGVIVTLAHPMWWSSASNQTQYTAQQLLALTERLKFVEIYNTYSRSENQSPYVDNPAYALDVLASDGRIIWGVAVSDSHEIGDRLTRANYDGNIKVFAPEKTRSAIWNSYLEGNFYCCEKIENRLNSIELKDNTLVIDIGDEAAVTKFIGNNGTILATVTGAVASYDIIGTEKYVRAEITLSNSTRIWTNPVYITDNLIEYP